MLISLAMNVLVELEDSIVSSMENSQMVYVAIRLCLTTSFRLIAALRPIASFAQMEWTLETGSCESLCALPRRTIAPTHKKSH